MSATGILLITVAVYLVLLLGIGIAAQRRTRADEDFFLGGRRSGALVAAVGASASSSSAWTLLGVSGAAYAWGVSAVWLFPSCVGGVAFNWYVIAPALRRASHDTNAMTVLDLLALPGSPWRRQLAGLASVIILVSMGAYVASQFQGAGKTFHEVFEIQPWVAVVVGAAVVLMYVFLGGFRAVSWTDTVQGLVMAGTAVLLPLVAFIEVEQLGGFADRLSHTPAGYMSLGGPRPAILAVGFVAGLLGIGLGYPGQPHIVKYYMAMRNDRDVMVAARRIAIAWSAVVFGGMLLLGICGRALYPSVADKEVVFVIAAQDLFHPAVAGVMLAAVLSAMMSTADSQLLVAAATVSHDLGAGGDSLWRSRAIVVALTLVAAAAALMGSDEIFSRVLFGWAAMGAAFGPLLLVRVVMRRHIAPAAMFAVMAVGFCLAVAAHTWFVDIGGHKDYANVAVQVVPFAVALGLSVAFSVRR